MGKSIQVLVYDDMHFAETGLKDVAAERTVRLALDGQTVELDLGAGNYAELRRQLEPWLKAGTPAGAEAEVDRPHGNTIEGRSYHAGLRVWAAANGLPFHEQKRADGLVSGYYYPRATQRAYAAHLAKLTP